jgi:hypothetical protein
VKHCAILAALTLSACALPGASGMGSFMTAMHPTQDFCASRGLTLDATTKQCTTPSQPPSTEATGTVPPSQAGKAQQPPSAARPVEAQPPAAAPQPSPQDRQRAAAAVPVEPDAVIDSKLQQDPDLMSELAHFVRASGYRCDGVSALHSASGSHGFKLVCNRSAYRYAIEDNDGRWTVTVE